MSEKSKNGNGSQRSNRMSSYVNFLTDRGKLIYLAIKNHCKKYGLEDVDYMEMSMLANAFDVYIKYAGECNKEGGAIQQAESGYRQVSPEYNMMKQQYDLVMKHSSKFGLNPGDRERLFSKIKQDKKEVEFDLG